ncbi:outer membrane beta-barrel protein [Candidatus Cardinium hertigii]|uniref:outer membrane beta-barrel protein n=1 Tax=Candidatus Cardinium hertigii TaxID=247481 RepID=UPI003D7DE66E
MAGLFACAAFNAQAEVDPFSWGAKIGLSLSFARGYDEVQIQGTKPTGKFLDTPWGHGGLYAEYAFSDYVGVGLEVGYMKLGSTLEAKTTTGVNKGEGEKKDANATDSTSSIVVASHGIAIPVHLQFYPLGREEESGILKVNVGLTTYVPVTAPICTQDGTKVPLDDTKKKELPSYTLAVHGGVGYEFPFGLAIDAKYAFGLFEKLNLEEGEEQTIFNNVTGLKSLSTQHLTLGVGFNFMSLLT